MNDQTGNWKLSNWQQFGDIARRLVQEKTRQRANAPGMTKTDEGTIENG